MITKRKIERLKLKALQPRPVPRGYRHAALALAGKSEWFGANTLKTNPKLVRTFGNGYSSACYHAEVDAILRVPRHLRTRVKLYVARFSKNGRLLLSKPCEHCIKFLQQEGVALKNVYYTDKAGLWVQL